MPPSIAHTCPVTQLALSESKNAIALATSCGAPTLRIGLRFCICSSFSGVLSRRAPSGDSTSDGATQLTRTDGASSAASAFVSPSSAPFAMDIDAWNGKPVVAATELMKTSDAPSAFLKLGK